MDARNRLVALRDWGDADVVLPVPGVVTYTDLESTGPARRVIQVAGATAVLDASEFAAPGAGRPGDFVKGTKVFAPAFAPGAWVPLAAEAPGGAANLEGIWDERVGLYYRCLPGAVIRAGDCLVADGVRIVPEGAEPFRALRPGRA